MAPVAGRRRRIKTLGDGTDYVLLLLLLLLLLLYLKKTINTNFTEEVCLLFVFLSLFSTMLAVPLILTTW